MHGISECLHGQNGHESGHVSHIKTWRVPWTQAHSISSMAGSMDAGMQQQPGGVGMYQYTVYRYAWEGRH